MKKTTVIIQKHYYLVLWMLSKINKFPRSQRYLLADRIENILLDILELLIDATYDTKGRVQKLKAVNLKLEKLRFMMRLAKDMKYVTAKGHAYFCSLVNEVGRMVGAWLKSAAAFKGKE